MRWRCLAFGCWRCPRHFHPCLRRVPGERAFVSAGYSAAGDGEVLAFNAVSVSDVFPTEHLHGQNHRGRALAGLMIQAAWVAVSYVIAGWRAPGNQKYSSVEMSEMKKNEYP